MLKKIIVSGKKIKYRRQEMELSQKQLATKIGTTQNHIKELEKNKISRPSFALIYLIAKKLCVNIYDLVEEDPGPDPPK